MDWLGILNQVFQICILPLLGLATAMLISFIKQKAQQGRDSAKNETVMNYISILEEVVIDCIEATNQTYVNELKGKNAFDAEAQKEALSKTVSAVTAILSTEVKENLGQIFGDLNTLITEKIESKIAQSKK